MKVVGDAPPIVAVAERGAEAGARSLAARWRE